MEYVICESSDPAELNRSFRLDAAARIGHILRLKNGHSYKVVDFELVELPDRSRSVRAALRRLG